jgi:hypothetical protein
MRVFHKTKGEKNVTKEPGKVISGPWKEKNEQMSLDDFLLQVRKYLDAMNIVLQVIEDISALFNVWHEKEHNERKNVIEKLYEILLPVQELCRLLETTTYLPISIVSLRYPLLLALCHLEEEIYSASVLINLAGTVSQGASPRGIMQRQSLRQKLLSLLLGSEEVIHLIHALLDQVHFEERRLAQSFASTVHYVPGR